LTYAATLRREVHREARVRGFAATRLSGTAGFVLVFLACLGIPSGFGFSAGPLGMPADAEVDGDPWMMPRTLAGDFVGFVVFVVLMFITVKSTGLRLSRLGRQRAAHWPGVRDWLAAYPTFADLPPAAAAIWDQYLAYGAALAPPSRRAAPSGSGSAGGATRGRRTAGAGGGSPYTLCTFAGSGASCRRWPGPSSSPGPCCGSIASAT